MKRLLVATAVALVAILGLIHCQDDYGCPEPMCKRCPDPSQKYELSPEGCLTCKCYNPCESCPSIDKCNLTYTLNTFGNKVYKATCT